MLTPDTLFTTITLETINDFVATHREEDLHLDFKTASSEMTRNDRKNLAIAASGFANSDGGVIIWGIEAPGTQGATAKAPIQPLSRFVGQLQQHTGVATNPIVDGIQHRAIEERSDEGYVVTLIPSSDRGPHMAKLGEDRYYKRSGDRFAIMEHFDVSDMFGRRARPDLTLDHVLTSGGVSHSVSIKREVRIALALTNHGRGSATAPFVHLTSVGGFVAYPSGITSPLPGAQFFFFKTETTRLIGNASFIIHPGTTYDVAILIAEFTDGAQIPDVAISASVAALDQPLRKQTIAISGASIRAIIGGS